MCNYCTYHASTEWELDCALADADDYTREAYWAAQRTHADDHADE